MIWKKGLEIVKMAILWKFNLFIFLSSTENMVIDFREKWKEGRERDRETLISHTCPYPFPGSNLQSKFVCACDLLVLRTTLQPTEPYQPGLDLFSFQIFAVPRFESLNWKIGIVCVCVILSFFKIIKKINTLLCFQVIFMYTYTHTHTHAHIPYTWK